MKVYRLEDLRIWQRAREFVDAVPAILETPPLRRDQELRTQLGAASVSILSNIAEGFGQASDRAFARHLFIARGSNNEAWSQLVVARSRGRISPEQLAATEELSQQLGRMLTTLIKHLQREDRKTRG